MIHNEQLPMSGIFTIAHLTFQEAARRKILLAALLLGILFLIVFGLGFHFIMLDFEVGTETSTLVELNAFRNFILMAGLYVVNFLTAIMTVLTSVDTVSGEINSGIIQTVVSKPIRRWEVIVGKWLGYAGMLSLYLLLLAGGVMGLIYFRSGYLPPNPLAGMGLIWLNALILLSVSIFGGTVFSTLANGVLVFGLYGVAFIGGWIETIGGFLPDQASSQTAINIGIITSLLLPSEALWKRAAHEIQSPLAAILGITPFSAGSYPSDVMILYSIAYLAMAIVLAIYQFNHRDL
jgi:ABC-type transport system involved in multi-copper enzyme maturation permease subunit